jgi:hypothetical protein
MTILEGLIRELCAKLRRDAEKLDREAERWTADFKAGRADNISRMAAIENKRHEQWARDCRDHAGMFEALLPAIAEEPSGENLLKTLGAIAKGILGDHAEVETMDLGPLPAWEDVDGHTHPATPVLRVDVLIDDKSFGMEGPATSAPGMVAHIATQIKGSELASPIIAPPPGFKA